MDVEFLDNEDCMRVRAENYLFGRHWYSTIVKVLAAKATVGGKKDSGWLFSPTAAEIEILP